MVTTNYYLRGERSNCVYIDISCADKRLRTSTGIEIDKKIFEQDDKGKYRVKSGKKTREQTEQVTRLESLQAKVSQHVTDCIRYEKPVMSFDIEAIINRYKTVADNVPKVVRPSLQTKKVSDGEDVLSPFLYEYDSIIKLAEEGKLLTPDNTRYERDSLKMWRTNRRILGEFIKETRINIEMQYLTLEAVQAFTSWMNNKNYSLNYVGIMNRQWKYVVKILFDRGFHKNILWADKKWKAIFEDVDYPYLSEKEVEKIWKYNCPTKYLELSRDRWVLEYCTGLRVKDSLRISMEHLGDNNITIVNNKTGKKVVIPYHPILEELLDKYNGALPEKQAEQTINDNMKKIAESAGITDMYTYSRTEGGQLKHITVPRYKLVTNHTARRSLVTNMIQNGINHDTGGDVVGMTQKTWTKYNKNEKERKAAMVQNNPMFQRKPKLKKVG